MKRKKAGRTPKKRRRRCRRFSQHVEQLELRAGLTDMLGVGAAFFGDSLLAEPIAGEFSFADGSDGSQLGLESASLDADTALQSSLPALEPGASSIVQQPGAALVADNPNHQPQNGSAPSATAGTAIGPAVSSAVLTDLFTNENFLASFGADITAGSAGLSAPSSFIPDAGIQPSGSTAANMLPQGQPTGTFEAGAGAVGLTGAVGLVGHQPFESQPGESMEWQAVFGGNDGDHGGASGETLILAGPETEIITPYQQTDPSDSTTFEGEFVVHLRPDVSSETLAAELGFVHSFSYPNTGKNLNVWRTPDDVAPGTRLFQWMRSDADNPERIAQLLESRPEVIDAYPVYKTSVVTKTTSDDPPIQTEKTR